MDEQPKWTMYYPEEHRRFQSNNDLGENSFCPQQFENRTIRQYAPMPQVHSNSFNRGNLPRTEFSTESSTHKYLSGNNRDRNHYLHASYNSNQGRALPPTPNEMAAMSKHNHYRNGLHQSVKSSLCNRQLPAIPTDTTQIGRSDTKHRKHRRRRGKSESDIDSDNKKSASKEQSETAVVLTVSIRSANQLKRLQQFSLDNNGVPYDTAITVQKKTDDRFFSRESSTDSNADLVKNVRRRRRRKSQCIIPMVISTIVILAGLLAAVAFILLRSDDSKSSSGAKGTGMILAITRMTVLNWKYHKNMTNNLSTEYIEFAVPFQTEVDELFLKSNYSNYYYGCEVTTLRYGSIKSVNELVFEDHGNIKNPSTIENTIKKSSPTYLYGKKTVLNLGSFVVDFHSIQVEIQTYNSPSRPDKPTKKDTSNNINVDHDFGHLTTNSPSESNTQTNKQGKQLTSSSDVDTPASNVNDENVIKTVSASQTSSGVGTTTLGQQITNSYEVTTDRVYSKSGLINNHDVVKKVLDKTTDPYVSVNSAVITSSDEAVSIRCRVRNLDNWEYIAVEHRSLSGITSIIINVTSGGVPLFPSMEFAHRLFLDLKLGKQSANITLNFTVQCSDEGSFTCKAHRKGQTFTGIGNLSIVEEPTKPVITLPIEIIQDKELVHPITCTANVGYPGGTLRWTMRPGGYNHFYQFPGTTEVTSGRCNNIVTSTFVYMPTIQGNGTLLKCEVLNEGFLGDQPLYDTGLIKIVPDDICRDYHDNTTIRHPYDCDRYITCYSESNFTVHQCPEEICFDPETGVCGQTGLSMSTTDAYLNEDVTSLTCRLLHLGEWYSLRISKLSTSGKNTQLLTVYNSTQIPEIQASLQKHVYATVQTARYEVIVTMWVYTLTCEDEGQYICEAYAPFSVENAIGTLNLKVRPQVPKLTIPTQIIDGRDLREKFVCEADVGYPGGAMFWEVRYSNESVYSDLPFNDSVTMEKTNCSTIIRREFTFTPSLEYDKMELRCIVRNSNSMPEGHQLFTNTNIFVIPANFCDPDETDLLPLPHPYDCTQYIQCIDDYAYVQKCSSGLCFNPENHQCDLPEPTESTIVDPNFPCKPNRNGVYFPHPFICNKYIWCVQGREIIQDCKLGTLYLDDGQCTFRTDQSYCFRNSTQSVT